jgi:hypothetical protein
VDQERTYDGARANRQWNQDRDSMSLRHSLPPHPTNAFPKRETPKNKSGERGMFFEPEKGPSTYHVSPAIHLNVKGCGLKSAPSFCLIVRGTETQG